MDKSVRRALKSGESFRRRMKPRWWRTWVPKYLRERPFLRLRIAAMLGIAGFGLFLSVQSPTRNATAQGIYFYQRIHQDFSRVLKEEMNYGEGHLPIVEKITSNVSLWENLAPFINGRLAQTFTNKKKSTGTIEIKIELFEREELFSFKFRSLDKPNTWISIQREKPRIAGIYACLLGLIVLLGTGRWTYTLFTALSIGIILDSGSDLILGGQKLLQLTMQTLSSKTFISLAILCLIGTIYNGGNLKKNKTPWTSKNKTTFWILFSALIFLPLFPWVEAIRARFVSQQGYPRTLWSATLLVLSLIAASVFILPLYWNVGTFELLSLAPYRAAPILAFSVIGVFLFSKKILNSYETERCFGIPNISVLDASQKSYDIRALAINVFALVLMIQMFKTWSIDSVSFEALAVKLGSSIPIGNWNQELAFINGGIMGFISGDSTAALNWMLATGNPLDQNGLGSVIGIAPLLDGCFWGALWSPFGYILPMISLGMLLRTGSTILASWIFALPATLIITLSFYFANFGIPAMVSGGLICLISCFLGLKLWRVRQKVMEQQMEDWLSIQSGLPLPEYTLDG